MSALISCWDSALLTSNDGRVFPRLPVCGNGSFRSMDNPRGPNVPVTLIDISHGGVCFVVAEELVVGQRIFVDMESPDGATRPLTLEAEVRWIVSDSEPGEMRVGCAWTQPLDIDELLQFC